MRESFLFWILLFYNVVLVSAKKVIIIPDLASDVELIQNNLFAGNVLLYKWNVNRFFYTELENFQTNYSDLLIDVKYKPVLEGIRQIGYIETRRLLAAALLTISIKLDQNILPEDELFIIGLGVHGGQIAHFISHFLTNTRRLPELVVPLVLLVAGPLLDKLIKSIPSVGDSILKSLIKTYHGSTDFVKNVILWKQVLLQECSNKLKFNPMLLESLDELLKQIFSRSNTYSEKKIKALITIGSTFANGSMLPNFWGVETYYNFYSLADKETFGVNRLEVRDVFAEGGLYAMVAEDCPGKNISSVHNVLVKCTDYCCSCNHTQYPCHQKLIYYALPWLLHTITSSNGLRDISIDTELYLFKDNPKDSSSISTFDPQSADYKLSRGLFNFFHRIKQSYSKVRKEKD